MRLITDQQLLEMSIYAFTNQIWPVARTEIFEELKLIKGILLRHNIGSAEELEDRLRKSDPRRSIMHDVTVAELLELKKEKEAKEGKT